MIRHAINTNRLTVHIVDDTTKKFMQARLPNRSNGWLTIPGAKNHMIKQVSE